MRTLGILGHGYHVPHRIVTNDELIQRHKLETSDDWIRQKTGIAARRMLGPDETTSDLAARAGEAALRNACVELDEVDLIIVATSSPDMIQPSTACLVQHKIGIRRAACFDISAVCSGFVYALKKGALKWVY